jgi:regulator of sigma E protease
MENLLSTIFYFVILISILVVIHEFGHFIAARISKMRVDIFSVGIGYRLFGWSKKDGFKFGPLPKDWNSEGITDYRISFFPIGGYVKIAGMVDESFDTEFANKAPMLYEFRSKSTLAKAFTISAGVIMNILLAIFIFAGIKYIEGEMLWATTEVGFVEDNSLAKTIGLMPGDLILTVNNKPVKTWDEVMRLFRFDDFGGNRSVIIERSGIQHTLYAEGTEIIKTMTNDKKNEKTLGLNPAHTFVLFDDVETLGAAGKAGFHAGDTIKSINGEIIYSSLQLRNIIKTHADSSLSVKLNRAGEEVSTTVIPNSEGLIGVTIVEGYNGPIQVRNFGLIESISSGTDEAWHSVVLLVGSIKQIVAGNIQVKQAIGGPIMIAKQASQRAQMGLVYFLNFMGLLSISLAAINILPFPALDGGHLVFILIEGITRREVPIKIKLAIQQVGFAILLLFMAFVVYNDIVR